MARSKPLPNTPIPDPDGEENAVDGESKMAGEEAKVADGEGKTTDGETKTMGAESDGGAKPLQCLTCNYQFESIKSTSNTFSPRALPQLLPNRPPRRASKALCHLALLVNLERFCGSLLLP